jgi:hypothetical protein
VIRSFIFTDNLIKEIKMTINPWHRLGGEIYIDPPERLPAPAITSASRAEKLFVSDVYRLFYIVGHKQTLCKAFNEFSADQIQTLRQKAASEESHVTFSFDKNNGELVVTDNVLQSKAYIGVNRLDESVRDKLQGRPESPWGRYLT